MRTSRRAETLECQRRPIVTTIKIMPCLDMKDGRVVEGGADVLLAASVFHFRTFSIQQVKDYLREKGLSVTS